MNTFADLSLTALPAVLVHSMKMKTREKLEVAMPLVLGVFASIASILLTIEMTDIISDDVVMPAQTLDIYEICFT